MAKCSATGPSANAGKNVNPPTITTVPISSPTNCVPPVGNVPAEAGTICFAAKFPAMHSTGTITKNRPANIPSANVRLKNSVFAFSPAKALPLVAAPEV
jgi:hypothetical protein